MVLGLLLACGSGRGADAAIIYDSTPMPLPVNVVSIGYACCAVSQFGDLIQFAGTERQLAQATATLSNQATNGTDAANPAWPPLGWTVPLTLALYTVDRSGASPTAGALTPPLPGRSEASAGCGSGFLGDDGACHSGIGQNVVFDLSGVTVPDEIIFGLAFNTHDYGSAPAGVAGPYDSLNFGLVGSPPTVGSDRQPDVVIWDSGDPALPTTGTPDVFSPDAGRAPYAPAIRFEAVVIPEPPALSPLAAALAGMAALLLTRRVVRRRR